MNKPRLLIVLTCLLFIILLSLGFNVASNKHPWGDEIYSLFKLSNTSYPQILLGIKGEGNTCPLYYLIQKAILDLAQYEIPAQWLQRNWDERDLYSAIILRINPVVSMALAVVLIFYYFARYHSLPAGLYSVTISLSSYMLWLYWAEARPYALWFLLSTCQSLLLLHIVHDNNPNSKSWRLLATTHILLSLTVILSLGQILAASALLWIFKERYWKKFLAMAIIPASIALLYYTIAHLDPTFVPDNIWKIIIPVFPLEWTFIILLYGIILMIKKSKMDISKEGRIYLAFIGLMAIVTAAILIIFKIRSPAQITGVELSIRYFINLTPIGIIAASLFSIDLVKTFQHLKWIKLNLIIGLIGLLVVGFFKNTMWMIGVY